MKRIYRLLLVLGASAAVFAGAYALLLTGTREPLRLETLYGDPAELGPYEISFSLADSVLEQRYTLRSGTITQKDHFLTEEHLWPVTTIRQSASAAPAYLYSIPNADDFDYLVRPSPAHTSNGALLPSGVYRMLQYSDDPERARPVLTLEPGETLEAFWALPGGLWCAAAHSGQAEVRQYSLSGELLETWPLGETKSGLLMPTYINTSYFITILSGSWSDGAWRVSSQYPPEPDGAQLFLLDDRVLIIGAWVEDESSGIDLYLAEPGKLLYHGRIATEIWKDYQNSGVLYSELSGGQIDPDAPVRYFTSPEVVEKT